MADHSPGCPATRVLGVGLCTCHEPKHDELCPASIATAATTSALGLTIRCQCDLSARARADTAEQIAQAIETLRGEHFEGTWPALEAAARIAREVGNAR